MKRKSVERNRKLLLNGSKTRRNVGDRKRSGVRIKSEFTKR